VERKKGRGTATSFDDRQLNECMVATIFSGSRESSVYVAEFFTTGVGRGSHSAWMNCYNGRGERRKELNRTFTCCRSLR
jgi:hypothetical protein